MHDEAGWLQQAQGLLHEALPEVRSGIRAGSRARAGRDFEPDIELQLGNRHILVEFKSARASRVSEVLGMLAQAILQLQQHRRRSSDVLVALIGLKAYGERLEGEIRSFLGVNAPEAGWGLIDARGRAVLEIPPLEIRWRRDGEPKSEDDPGSSRVERSLFTDLNRWMLKILLLRNATESLWMGPRAVPRHPTQLAAIAGVSVEKAHRFALAFEKEGYLRRTPEGLRLVRIRSLLDAWLQQERGESTRTLDVRPLLPAGKGDEPPVPVEARTEAVLGGAMAARKRNLLHFSGPHVALVHLRLPVADAMAAWKLENADPQHAALRLRKARYPESTFRGAVSRSGKLPLVDVWQLALDAVTDGPRGLEQAEFVLDRVMGIQEGGA